jgi:hypothetical protein
LILIVVDRERFVLGDGRVVYFNPHSGEVSLEPRDVVKDVRGGILAEE